MMSPKSLHPTKQTLIDTVVTLMDTQPVMEINSDQVLEISGISKGSLYHHFEDFPELVESAMVTRFARSVDNSIMMLNEIINNSKSREEVVEGLKKVTRATQAEELMPHRAERVIAIAKAIRIPRMKDHLGEEQNRLTEALADLYRESVERGWADPAIDPRVVGVMVQAYTIGKIVDDITPTRMKAENWNSAIDLVLEKVFFPKRP
jgi:AcrR family transcriptional regulator